MFRIRLGTCPPTPIAWLTCTQGAPEGEKAADRVKIAAGHVPKARSAHSAVVHGDSMYVYGGWFGRNSDTHSDFWAFHFRACTILRCYKQANLIARSDQHLAADS